MYHLGFQMTNPSRDDLERMNSGLPNAIGIPLGFQIPYHNRQIDFVLKPLCGLLH